MITPLRPHWLEPFHVPDRVFVTLAIVVMIGTAALQFWAWPQLPERIPAHINVVGRVDAYMEKNILSVFSITLLNILIALIIAIAYANPEQTNLPSMKRWNDLSVKVKSQLQMAVRHFFVIVLTWISLIMATVNVIFLSEGLMVRVPLVTIFLIGLVGLMLVSIGGYTMVISRWLETIPSRRRIRR